jgi:ComF family protein
MRHGALQSLWRGLIDLVYPPRCVICADHRISERNRFVCEHCWCNVAQAEIPPAQRWGIAEDAEAGIDLDLAAWYYDGEMAALIPSMKYQGRPTLAKILGSLAAARLQPALQAALQSPAVLVPVPLHPRRRRERGFDQSLLIAQALSKRWGIAVLPAALRRIRFTEKQVRLSAQQRRENVAGAFAVDKRFSANRGLVLLVDDVITTGATVNGCAALLKTTGVEQVFAVTLARTDQRRGANKIS